MEYIWWRIVVVIDEWDREYEVFTIYTPTNLGSECIQYVFHAVM